MTLPFRRRHNDAEASHDRARSLIGARFLEPIDPSDDTWLAAHLAGCAECARDAAAYEVDRQLLRSLRDTSPEPPRDLWARTAAEIERSRGRGDRAARPARTLRIGRVPLGVMSGLLVVLVVIGASLAPRGGLPIVNPGASDVTAGSPGALATPMAVTAAAITWIQVSADGSYDLLQANVNEVCADARDACAPLNTKTSTRLTLSQDPQSLLLSPSQSEIAVVTKSSASRGSDIVVVPVSTASSPTPSPVSTDTTTTTPPSVAPSPTPARPTATPPPATPSVAPSPPRSGPPSIEPSGSPFPAGSEAPPSGHAIVTGVILVGDAAYSPDGQWLAFSARPADGSTGPDLYTWHVGDATATAVTADHRTFFAGWLGAQIVADRVDPASAGPEATGAPDASADPAAAPSPATTTDPGGASGSPSPPIAQDHPVAFMLDPATGSTTPIRGLDMWLPTFDPTGTSVVYWSGTLIPDGTGSGWTLGAGHLVIDSWQDGSPSAPAPGTSSVAPVSTPASAAPGEPGATSGVDASAAPPAPAIGPAGHPVALAEDPITGFDAWFDPTGTRLAVWIADPADATIGTLRLIVLDPETRQIDPSANPLPGVAALRGVSISAGRLAWVTPPGQDGQGSHVQVLAWNGRAFGQVRTFEGDRFLVAR